MSIRTILVDDEPLANQGLRLRLEAHDDVEVIATAANGREAIRMIKTHKPDLVFLDIQMPGFDGFSVIQGLMEVEPPLFVFVTAYGDHALRAFEAQCGPDIESALRRVRTGSDVRDDARQILRQRLFVGTRQSGPRIAAYSGRGPLRLWLRVTVVRIVLEILDRESREPQADETGA